jgi:hypothetical protein
MGQLFIKTKLGGRKEIVDVGLRVIKVVVVV